MTYFCLQPLSKYCYLSVNSIISYSVKSVVEIVIEGWTHVVAGIPAALSYLLMLAAWGNSPIAGGTFRWCHLAVNIRAHLRLELLV